MEFKKWLVQESVLNVPLNKIYGWKPKADQTIEDIRQNKLSYSADSPLILSRLDNPRGYFFIMDGYHRFLQAILANQATLPATIDSFVPRIERTGGAHSSMVNEKVHLLPYFSKAFSDDRSN